MLLSGGVSRGRKHSPMTGQFHAIGDAGCERHGRSTQTERSQSRWRWHSFGVGVPAAGLSLAATLPSHALIHTAEGEFFLEVLVRASEHCSLHVTKVKEREIWDRGTTVFRLPSADLQQRIDGLGKSLGPPWRVDEKLASLAAWIALAESK